MGCLGGFIKPSNRGIEHLGHSYRSASTNGKDFPACRTYSEDQDIGGRKTSIGVCSWEAGWDLFC
jgi:hypothetical protein